VLEVRGLTHSFGGLSEVDSVDFEVQRGEVVGLIGPNGTWKTTVFNLISGAIRARQGSIHFRGEEITGLRPDPVDLATEIQAMG
jgi:branched-chain amino acid transport system ATP-binding protein